jgi:AcrR family transcriptional regulator
VPKIPASERDAFYEARRADLASIALRLWSERGFDQTSVELIAREAGVSKGTFYLYFDTKDALLEDVMRRNSLVPHVLELIDDLQHRSLEDAVRGFVEGAWRHLSDHRELVLVVLREVPTHLAEAQQLIERVMAPANKVLADYLAERIAPERAEKLSLVIAVRSLLGMVLFTFLSQEVLGLGKVLPVPEAEITETIAELFLRGLTSQEIAET